MAKNQTIRVQAQVLQADEDAFVALKGMRDYRPVNPAYSIDALTSTHAAMRAAQEAELHAQNALAAARDAAIAAQWDYHNLVLGVKSQVVAQYGPDSDQVAALGLKKKAERKAPTRASKPAV